MKQYQPHGNHAVADFLFGLFFCLFFRISSWLCSVPMWATLLLHFLVGLSLKWFWATLAVWLLAGFLRYSMIVFAQRSSNAPTLERPNKNPYSVSNKNEKEQ